jgi:hypothetical protein
VVFTIQSAVLQLIDQALHERKAVATRHPFTNRFIQSVGMCCVGIECDTVIAQQDADLRTRSG